MSTELDLYNGSDLPGRQHYASQIACAGSLLPKGIREGVAPTDTTAIAARAFLQMETGSMLGLHPIAALQGINVIEGQPTLKPALMAALVRKAGHKLRVQQEGTVETGDLKVTVTLVRDDDPDAAFSATWTPQRAARAGLCRYELDQATGQWAVVARSKQGNPLPWQSYTEALLYARALSESCRMGAPDVLYGIGYTPEELGMAVDGQGNPIDGGDATVEQVAEPAPQPKRRAPAKGRQGTRRPTPEAPADDAAVAEHAEVVEGEAIETEQPQQPEPEAHTVEPEPEQPRQVDPLLEQVGVETPADEVPMYAEDVPPADGPSDDGDVPPEDAYELQAPEVVDSRTGTVYPTQAAMDAALKAERAERQAEREQAPAEPAPVGESVDWKARLKAATTVAEVRAVWDGSHLDGSITSELKAAIVARRTELETPKA